MFLYPDYSLTVIKCQCGFDIQIIVHEVGLFHFCRLRAHVLAASWHVVDLFFGARLHFLNIFEEFFCECLIFVAIC